MNSSIAASSSPAPVTPIRPSTAAPLSYAELLAAHDAYRRQATVFATALIERGFEDVVDAELSGLDEG